MIRIASVVEGHGEVVALPVLMRRIVAERFPELYVEFPRPMREQADRLLAPDNHAPLERALRFAAIQAGASGAVLVVVDCDKGVPPCEAGPALQRRVDALLVTHRARVAMPHMEFETWFVAAAASISGKRGLPADLAPPTDPEAIRDAKGWLDVRMKQESGRKYSPRTDQPALAAIMDLEQARGVGSFRKFEKEVLAAVAHCLDE